MAAQMALALDGCAAGEHDTATCDHCIEAAFTDQRFYLLVDAPRPLDAWRLSFVGASGLRGVGDKMTVVHVISRPAGGEIRGYVLTGDGALRQRLPNYAGDWPALDAAVLARVPGARSVLASTTERS